MTCFESPGRLNIIGEHTDYNDGYVLPFAINLYVRSCVEESSRFVLISHTLGEKVVMDSIEKRNDWTDYVMGVLDGIERLGYRVPPMRVEISSTLPIGAGLSSSSALTTSVASAVVKHLNLDLSRKDIFEVCVKAERDFVGVKGGVMDQFTSLFSKKGYAIFLDNLSMEHEYIPLDLKGMSFAVVDSGVKHTLTDGGYNRRREESDGVLKALKKKSHRDLSFENLYDLENPILRKRARHVMEENLRVLRVVEALKDGKIDEIGLLLYESHNSLRDLYEVSCDETDFIVDFFRYNRAPGARMVGGGFGGGVIVLGHRDEIEEIFRDLEALYSKRFGVEPKILFVESSEGAREVKA